MCSSRDAERIPRFPWLLSVLYSEFQTTFNAVLCVYVCVCVCVCFKQGQEQMLWDAAELTQAQSWDWDAYYSQTGTGTSGAYVETTQPKRSASLVALHQTDAQSDGALGGGCGVCTGSLLPLLLPHRCSRAVALHCVDSQRDGALDRALRCTNNCGTALAEPPLCTGLTATAMAL